MYLFFDKNGTLLEIVNDSALRQYNQDANKMYVYIQDEDGSISGKIDPAIIGLTHRYQKSNNKIVKGAQIVRPKDGTQYKEGVFEYKEVPFNRKRDLKHFSYGRRYEFFVVDIPSGTVAPVDYEGDGTTTVEFVTEGTVFDVAGTVLATLTAVYEEQSNLVLERFAFTVEESVPTTDGALTGSQFAWLIGEIIRMDSRVEGHYDYDKQNNRPIINMDMNSPDFIAKASNYYRHIGENSAEHRKGLIYYCPEDGTLVEIDGGTSLNLNGQYTEEATVYAPTNGGDNTGVKVLVPHGDGEEPTWERLSVSSSGSVTSAGVTYSIELGDNSVGTITLPKETYIEDIVFNGSTKIVTFKYNGGSGRGEKTVDLSKLVDVYTAGNGLQKSGNEFSIKTNSSYLSTSSQGLSVNASSIAGLAQIYLNGSRKTANSNQFYAPTTYHTSNSNSSCWVLVPNGINTAPIWERIYVEKSGLTYTLKLGNYMIGKIELTQEIYLDDVKYNSDTNKLVFTYNTASGQSAIEVDLTDLVDMYEAGNGLVRDNGVFSIKIAPDSEKYLKATAEGLVFDESALPIGGGGTAAGNGGSFIAKTEDEMTALLKPENVGALVSYMGEGDGQPAKNAEISVGDTISSLYFDIDKEPELSAFTYGEYNQVSIDFDGGSYYVLATAKIPADESPSGKDEYQIFLGEGEVLVYSSLSWEEDGVVLFTEGWQQPIIDAGGKVDFSEAGVVSNIDQVSVWSTFVSKEPIARGSSYKKNTLYMVVEEEKEPESATGTPFEVGQTYETIYFNTSVTPVLEALTLSGDGYAQLITSGTHGDYGLFYYDMNILTGGTVSARCIMAFLKGYEDGPMVIYSTASFDWEGVVASEGWNLDQIAWGDSVAATDQQDKWLPYISSAPFATASADEFAVGQSIGTIYFNTDVEPDLSQITLTDGFASLILANGDWCVEIYDMALMSGGSINGLAMVMSNETNESRMVSYSTVDFELDGVVATKGWNTDLVAKGGVFVNASGDTNTIHTVNQQDLWKSYISPKPFASEEESAPKIIAKQIGGESGGNTEEIEKSVSELSDKIDKIVAPTTTREVNSDGSCYVLTPNGTTEPTWERIAVTTSNNLDYSVTVGGKNAGTINLTQEIYLDTVVYDSATNKLRFTYNTASGKSTIEVDLSALAGGNVALPESHMVTFGGGYSWMGATLNGKSCYVSTVNLTDFGFSSNITSGGCIILSPNTSNDAELIRTYGVFYSIKYNDGRISVYAQSPAVILGHPEIAFNATYIPSGDTSSNGAVIIQNSYDGTDISTVAIKTTDWQTYWGDVNEDGEANEVIYYQSPTYAIDYTSYVVFAPADAESQKEMIRCGAYTATENLVGGWAGAYPFAIRVQTLPTIDITLKKMTTWVGEEMGIATLNLPTAPPLPSVTPADSGKFLRVDANGKWTAQSIPYAEEVSF